MNEFKIKPERVEEWKDVVSKNCMDGYSFGVVQGAVAVMGALDNPETTCKEANDKMYGMDLTGFMAGCIAQWVNRFHVRGDEFRIFWNAQYGVDEEKAKGGTVNPAIMEFPS